MRRGETAAVAGAHFASAFAALGLPPYLAQLLPELGDPEARWAGILYVVPTLCTALAAPLWGRLADRVGAKPLLIRAQFGLALAFGLAAVAQDLPTLAVALAAQGLLGGTYSASTAYLASRLAGSGLAAALTLMQASARAALVAAPVLAGLLSEILDIRQMYGLAALLPVAAAATTLFMAGPVRPRTAVRTAAASRGAAEPGVEPAAQASISVAGLCLAEAGFVLVTVVSYPYFLPLTRQLAPGLPPALAGLLFAAPHICYLLAAAPFLRLLRCRARTGLAAGYALAAASAVAHLLPAIWPGPGSLELLLLGRLLLGGALALGLPSLSLLASEAAAVSRPGTLFGTVEASSKGGAVLAGVAASSLALFGPAAPLAVPVVAGTFLALAASRFTAARASKPHKTLERSLT